MPTHEVLTKSFIRSPAFPLYLQGLCLIEFTAYREKWERQADVPVSFNPVEVEPYKHVKNGKLIKTFKATQAVINDETGLVIGQIETVIELDGVEL